MLIIVLIEPNRLNMESLVEFSTMNVNPLFAQSKIYYANNTKGNNFFNKYFNENSFQFINSSTSNINGDLIQKAFIRCRLDLSSIKLELEFLMKKEI